MIFRASLYSVLNHPHIVYSGSVMMTRQKAAGPRAPGKLGRALHSRGVRPCPTSHPTPPRPCTPAAALPPGSESGQHGRQVLRELSKNCSAIRGCNTSDMTPDELTQLAQTCQSATLALQQHGAQLPSREFSFLGSSIWQSGRLLAGQNSTEPHRAAHAALVAATVAAALGAPALGIARVDNWSGLLYGLVKAEAGAGESTPGLQDLLAYAESCLTPQVWLAAHRDGVRPQAISLLLWTYATAGYQGDVTSLAVEASGAFTQVLNSASPQSVANIIWALGDLGCSVGGQPGITTLLIGVVEYVREGGMQQAKSQEWSNLLWGLAKVECSMDLITARGAAVDVQPVVIAAGRALQGNIMQRAAPQEVANIIWALGTLGCSVGGQPGITPLLTSVVKYVQLGGMRQATLQAWSNLLWGLAMVKCSVDPATQGGAAVDVRPVLVAAVNTLHGLGMQRVKPQDLSNTTWALATMGCRVGGQPDITPVLVWVVKHEQQGGMRHAKPQAWSNLMWALATMGCQAPQLSPLITATRQAVSDAKYNTAKPQEIANLLWALTKLNSEKFMLQPVLDMLLPAITRLAHSGKFTIVGLTQILYALEHYGMSAAKERLLVGLPSTQFAAYTADGRSAWSKQRIRPKFDSPTTM